MNALYRMLLVSCSALGMSCGAESSEQTGGVALYFDEIAGEWNLTISDTAQCAGIEAPLAVSLRILDEVGRGPLGNMQVAGTWSADEVRGGEMAGSLSSRIPGYAGLWLYTGARTGALTDSAAHLLATLDDYESLRGILIDGDPYLPLFSVRPCSFRVRGLKVSR